MTSEFPPTPFAPKEEDTMTTIPPKSPDTTYDQWRKGDVLNHRNKTENMRVIFKYFGTELKRYDVFYNDHGNMFGTKDFYNVTLNERWEEQTRDRMAVRVAEDHAELEEKGYTVDPIKAITDERGKNYGKPIDHFSATTRLNRLWLNERDRGTIEGMDPNTDDALKHGVYMIIDKLVRAAQNPMHKDNWDDIEGYARCIKDALGLEAK